MVVPVSDFVDLPDNENIELLVTRLWRSLCISEKLENGKHGG